MLPLNADERFILGHVTMFGSEGYPLQKFGRKWSWAYRGVSMPIVFNTKREAVASFEGYYRMLVERSRARN